MFVLTAEKNLLTIQEKETLTSGSVNVYCVNFSFSPDWDGLDKIVVFRALEESRSVLLDHTNECMIPWESLKEPRTNLFCGVYGTRDGEIVLPTIWCSLGRILPGTVPGEDVKSPTPDMWEQLLLQSQQAVETVRQLREEADSGAFNGPEGPQGPQGETGPQGEKGDPGMPGMPQDDVLAAIERAAAPLAEKSELEELKAFAGYNNETVAGLCVDYENGTFTRLAGAVGKDAGEAFNIFPMYGERKRCIVEDSGNIIAWRESDGWYDNHGMRIDVDETDPKGQVMVYQPAFWYRVVPIKLDKNTGSGIGYHIRKANYYVSSIPKPGFKLHPAFYDESGEPVEYILFSAYEGSMWDKSSHQYVNDNKDASVRYENGDLLCSAANKKPISGKLQTIGTRSNLEEMAQNRGPGWHLSTIKAEAANQLLMMIELGTMNTQTAIGQGVVSIASNGSYNCSSLTGSTAELGNKTGQASKTINENGEGETPYIEDGKVSVSYRGVENPWGNIWKHINGVNGWVDDTIGSVQIYIAADFSFDSSKHNENYKAVGFAVAKINGYIKAVGYGKEEYDWLVMGSDVGGTAELPVGDRLYADLAGSGHNILRHGGGWNTSSDAGGFCSRFDNNPDLRFLDIGGRLLYIPQKNQQ